MVVLNIYKGFAICLLFFVKKCFTQYSWMRLINEMNPGDNRGLAEVGTIVREIVASSYDPDQIKVYSARTPIWSDGVVPYIVDEDSYDDRLIKKLDNFFLNIQKATGVVFKKLPSWQKKEGRYLFIINRRGVTECLPFENLPAEGVVKLTIGYDCFDEYYLGRYTMQLLGIPLQHNAPNRDQHIQIMLDNVSEDKQKHFQMVSPENWPFKEDQLGYDQSSVTHFHPLEFTKQGRETFLIKNAVAFEKPTRMSHEDIMKIHFIYYDAIKQPLVEKTIEMCKRLYKD